MSYHFKIYISISKTFAGLQTKLVWGVTADVAWLTEHLWEKMYVYFIYWHVHVVGFFSNNQHNMLHGINNIKITWCYLGAQIHRTGDVREVGRMYIWWIQSHLQGFELWTHSASAMVRLKCGQNCRLGIGSGQVSSDSYESSEIDSWQMALMSHLKVMAGGLALLSHSKVTAGIWL